tara:strand:- start:14 stop:808 length:795 start_codon:yes stop_codon:yes gene_type:complete
MQRPVSPSLLIEEFEGEELTQRLADLDEALRPANEKRGVIYQLRFPDGMRYIGQAVNLDKRMSAHKHRGRCPRVKEWKDKFGWESVSIEVIERPLCQFLNACETHQIDERNTLWPSGLNMARGGDVPDAECVRASWRDNEIRARHSAGRKAAWTDPVKRNNIMAGRAASAKVAAAKAAKKQNAPQANAKRTVSWEAKRAARLVGLTGKKLKQRLARLDRDRERARRKAREKLTSSRSLPSATGGAFVSDQDVEGEEWDMSDECD